MDIDGLDPFVLDHDRQAPLGLLRTCGVKHSATAECDARGPRSFEEASARSHSGFLRSRIYSQDPACRRLSDTIVRPRHRLIKRHLVTARMRRRFAAAVSPPPAPAAAPVAVAGYRY
jgi:hypothetical protein